MRALVWLSLVVACGRVRFDAIGSGDGGAPLDAALDASAPGPLVQAVAYDVASGSFVVDGSHGGLSTVGAGHMVLVTCSTPRSSGPCTPVSVPAATWVQIDGGVDLSVYYVCSAPAITSITVMNGAAPALAIVTEWTGVAATGCFDTGQTSVACALAPTPWSLNASMTSQATELVVTLGGAGGTTDSWAVNASYTMAKNASGSMGSVSAFVADKSVNAVAAYTASGTIDAWTDTCFNDLFTFKSQ